MKNLILVLFFLWITVDIFSQANPDSLRQVISRSNRDTNEVNALTNLANITSPDSADKYLEQALVLSAALNYKRGEADCFILKSAFTFTQDPGESIFHALNALKIYKELGNQPGMVIAHGALQGCYRELGDYRNALSHAFEGLQIAKRNNVNDGILFMQGQKIYAAFFAEIAQTYLLMNNLDSAKHFAEKSINEKEFHYGAQWNFPVYLLATIQNLQGNHKAALDQYRYAIPLAVQNKFYRDTLQIFSGMSTAFRNLGQLDSSLHYASLVVQSTNPKREIKTYLEALYNLAVGYKLVGNKDSALKYIELNYTNRDSMIGKEKERIIQNITFTEKLKQQELAAAKAKYKSQLQIFILGAGLLMLLLITGILWRNNKLKQKAKNKIEVAYSELKTTQAQLILSEKMASLGELTAGIAHEIQNPLNFVNNFSEVSNELVDEMKTGLATGNTQLANEIADDIKQNLEKINHHGKRADAIVKGMLQHSRSSSGVKEPTDINALVDEYLRLAYHGLKARDTSFNATMKTDFDASIGNINIIPQDIGRVILNLINNAFYVVDEKKKSGIENYEPTVSVSTKKEKDKVEIKVKDNGNGILQKVLDKIFQPFFTTKPTGQGTGLGLSLSYDIVKAHGGELKVETKEGEGSDFIISLPVT